MFTTVDQVKQIIARYLQDTGRGGFQTGTISSLSPLKIKIGPKIEITRKSLIILEGAIGLRLTTEGGTATLRAPLKIGDGILLMTQPRADGKQMYVLMGRVEEYEEAREVSV